MLVSLYTSRVVLNALGVEDFGIYNVVGESGKRRRLQERYCISQNNFLSL